MDLALHTHALRREFGTFVAVDGIDLVMPRGSLYGFVGPNGAGKSTTIKCLTGLLALMDRKSAAGQMVADYSHGMRKKTSLAAARAQDARRENLALVAQGR